LKMSTSDKLLIEKFKAGDDDSFRKLVEKYQSKVYSIVLAMVGDKNDADDLSQEVFIKVYRFLPKFKGKSKFFTWLYRITVNTCINAKNGKNKKDEVISLFTPVDEKGNFLYTRMPQENFKSPIEALKNRELNVKIKSAVDSLSDGLREVFILREIEDLSYKELAEVFQCSEGTIKSRLFRAREALREKLEPYLDML